MDIQKSLKQAWEILLLKEPTMQAVAKDPQALNPALIILAGASVLSGLGAFLFPSVMGMVTYQPGILDVLVQILVSIAFGIAWLYLTGFLATELFKSKLDMNGYVRLMGHATLVNALGLFPALTPISGIWSLVVMCFVLHNLGKMQAGSIILLILLEALIFGVLGMSLVFMGFGMGGIMIF